nr:MAG: hypothetical protein DIU56_05150 [Pseudomonadota bacterium]
MFLTSNGIVGSLLRFTILRPLFTGGIVPHSFEPVRLVAARLFEEEVLFAHVSLSTAGGTASPALSAPGFLH